MELFRVELNHTFVLMKKSWHFEVSPQGHKNSTAHVQWMIMKNKNEFREKYKVEFCVWWLFNLHYKILKCMYSLQSFNIFYYHPHRTSVESEQKNGQVLIFLLTFYTAIMEVILNNAKTKASPLSIL